MQTRSATTQISALRAQRRSRRLSLQQAATLAEIDIGHLSRVERGEASLSVAALARLAKVIGLTALEQDLELYAMPPETRSPAVAGKRASARSSSDGKRIAH